MIRYLLISVLLLAYLLSNGQDISIPVGYKILDQKEGDLNKDSISEKVVVFDTNDSTEFGTVREIRIYKKAGNKWILLTSSKMRLAQVKQGE